MAVPAKRLAKRPAGRASGTGLMRGLALALALGLFGLAAPAAAQGMLCPALPARAPLPREAQPEYLADPGWQGGVAAVSQQLAATDVGRARLVFLGDSITASWFPLIYQQFYGHRSPLNLGVGGDFTQGMLWRLEHGQWPVALRPQAVVLLIGTNNAQYSNRPADIALGIAEVIRFINRQSPQTRILLVGLLPRGADASDPVRRVTEQVNVLIARCADQRSVFYSDAGTMLVDGQGRLPEQLAFDRLHLTMVGYAVLAAAMEPQIRRLLGE